MPESSFRERIKECRVATLPPLPPPILFAFCGKLTEEEVEDSRLFSSSLFFLNFFPISSSLPLFFFFLTNGLGKKQFRFKQIFSQSVKAQVGENMQEEGIGQRVPHTCSYSEGGAQ